MHFSIPEIREIKTGFKTFIAYDIYINGCFHCSLRYRQLYHFHVQLKKAFGANSLHDFPPKKILPLNSGQIEERRSQLEKYIQIASQDSQIVNSDIFNGFLLAAQQESHNDLMSTSSDCIDIYQLDWQPTRLMISAQENSEIVLKKYCQTIKLPPEHLSYFCLFLVKRNGNDYSLVRRLQNFESPLLTLKTKNQVNDNNCDANNGYMIIIHKSYWDITFDHDLYDDLISLNIIYLQAKHDIENGYIQIKDDITQRHLTQLKNEANKLEYLRLASKQKFYGYVHFDECFCDCDIFSTSTTTTNKISVKIFAGNQELIIIRCDNTNHQDEEKEEFIFRVIRIKCWRLTTSNQSTKSTSDNKNHNNLNHSKKEDSTPKHRYELSFEYLLDKNLKWVTIYSAQAVLISYCLQSMVEEMLLKREGKKFRSEGLVLRYNTSPISNLAMNSNSNNNNSLKNKKTNSSSSNVPNNNIENNNGKYQEWIFFKKDGSHVPLCSSSSSSTSTTTTTTEKNLINTISNDHVDSSLISNNHHQKIDQMNDKSIITAQFHEMTIMENGVFNEIGDDDL